MELSLFGREGEKHDQCTEGQLRQAISCGVPSVTDLIDRTHSALQHALIYYETM